MALVMTVEPGFGGQKFMEAQCAKLTALRERAAMQNHSMDLQVDGGIDVSTIGIAAKAGANVFVAGSALFGREDYSASVKALREQAQQVI